MEQPFSEPENKTTLIPTNGNRLDKTKIQFLICALLYFFLVALFFKSIWIILPISGLVVLKLACSAKTYFTFSSEGFQYRLSFSRIHFYRWDEVDYFYLRQYELRTRWHKFICIDLMMGLKTRTPFSGNYVSLGSPLIKTFTRMDEVADDFNRYMAQYTN